MSVICLACVLFSHHILLCAITEYKTGERKQQYTMEQS